MNSEYIYYDQRNRDLLSINQRIISHGDYLKVSLNEVVSFMGTTSFTGLI